MGFEVFHVNALDQSSVNHAKILAVLAGGEEHSIRPYIYWCIVVPWYLRQHLSNKLRVGHIYVQQLRHTSPS